MAALGANLLARQKPTEQPFRGELLAQPSVAHPFGVDGVGRDVWSRVLFGARTTAMIAGGAVTMALAVGIFLGGMAGMIGGWTDVVISRATDFLLSFPSLLIGLALLTVLEPSPRSVMWAVAVASTPVMVRQIRAGVLSERVKPYAMAAAAVGASHWRIAMREILPNLAGLILTVTTLQLGSAVLEASGLAFLGLSGQPDQPEWGLMLKEEFRYFRSAPHLCMAPGLAISWTVLGCNLLGDGLREWRSGRPPAAGEASPSRAGAVSRLFSELCRPDFLW
jgi:peptide/nickel transport system permease protein